jgi:hypothetical protein
MENQEIINSFKNAEGIMLQIISLEDEKIQKDYEGC